MDLKANLKKSDIHLAKIETKATNELISTYKATLKEVNGKIAEYYAKYSSEGILTYSEMVKYDRLVRLKKDLDGTVLELRKQVAKGIDGLAYNSYVEAYYYTAYAVEMEVGVRLGYAKLVPEHIKASIQNPISGLTLKETLERDRINILIKVRQSVTQGLILGEDYKHISYRLRETFEKDANKSLLVARTEAHRCQQDGRLESGYETEDLGVNMVKVWDSTLDRDTRDAHANLDGTAIGVDEDFESDNGGVGQAPGEMGTPEDDCNCRCQLRFEIQGYSSKVRTARDEAGRTQTIQYQTYNEWREDKGF